MADSGNATVFEALACRSLNIDGTGSVTGLRVSTSGANLVTPSTSADDLVLNGPLTTGISILSSQYGNIFFGNGADNDVGKITYDHTDNSIKLYVGASDALYFNTDRNIQMGNATDITPDLYAANLTSGAIFISGGGLWYKGFSGTYTEVAVA